MSPRFAVLVLALTWAADLDTERCRQIAAASGLDGAPVITIYQCGLRSLQVR